MKLLIIACTIFICGVIVLCTDYIVVRAVGSLPGVTIVSRGILLPGVGWAMLLIGGIMVAYNLLKGKE